jgi:hypothetical protein
MSYLSTDPRDVKSARVNADTDGDNTVIAGVAGKKLRIIGYQLTASAAGVVTLKDDAASPVTHAELNAGASVPIPFAGSVWCPAFDVAAGEGLVINTQAGQDVNGHIAYVPFD